MSNAQVSPPGWYADQETGGTGFWDGTAWTGDKRPARRPFAAAASHRGWGIFLAVLGPLMILMSPSYLLADPAEYDSSPLILFLSGLIGGGALLALGIYLLRGQGPTTRSIQKRLELQASATPHISPDSELGDNHNSFPADHFGAAAAQIKALSDPQTAKALQELQKLLYTRTLTEEEFQSAKDALLADYSNRSRSSPYNGAS